MTTYFLFKEPSVAYGARTFIIFIALIVVLFSLFFALSFIVENFSSKKIYFLLLCFGFSVLYFGITNFIIVSIALFSIGIIFYAVLLLTGQVDKTDKKREFIRYIDSKIKEPIHERESYDPIEQIKQDEILSVSKRKKPDYREKEQIDYSHVKSVLKKIDCFPLSPSDRKVVRELELYLMEAENGDDRTEIKEKINDNLGCLLKIMAKYGA